MRATLVMSVVVAFGVSNVRAEDRAAPIATTDEALAAEARKHYEEGTKAFNLAEFARAVAEFKIAYNAKPDPLLLYNIGQSFRLAGDDGQALLFYKSFLRNLPDAPNRREVEGRIRTLEKRVAEHKVAAQSQNQNPDKETGVLASPPVIVAPAAAIPSAVSPPPPLAAAPQARRPGAAGEPPSGTPLPGASSAAVATPRAMPTPGLELAAAGPTPLEPLPSGRQVDISTAPARAGQSGAEDDEKPIYKKWWFWAGVAAVAVVGIAVAGNVNKSPSTTLGLYQPTFK